MYFPIALLPVSRVGDVTAASNSMQSFVVPLLSVLDGIGGLLCALGIMYSAYLFMTSSGDAGRLQHAKRMLRNAIVGLVIVLAATAGTAICTTPTLPQLQEVALHFQRLLKLNQQVVQEVGLPSS